MKWNKKKAKTPVYVNFITRFSSCHICSTEYPPPLTPKHSSYTQFNILYQNYAYTPPTYTYPLLDLSVTSLWPCCGDCHHSLELMEVYGSLTVLLPLSGFLWNATVSSFLRFFYGYHQRIPVPSTMIQTFISLTYM